MKYIFYKALKKIQNKINLYFKMMENKEFYNRFNKSKGFIGEGVKFGKNVTISGLDEIFIGNNVHIGTGCFIRGEGGLEIGDNTIISRNVVIYTNSHQYCGNLLPFDHNYVNRRVIIRKNCWIGMNVTISPGTNIGEGAIIALGSKIFGSIPDLAIIGSNTPSIIKFRNKEHYKKLEKNGNYAKENGLPLNSNCNNN